jgi:hypothetical protein
MTRVALAFTLFLAFISADVGAAWAQSQMTVREFNQIAASAPRNPTALLRPSVGRARSALEAAFESARAEEAAARRAGRRPPFCIPARTNISPNDVMARMAAVPVSQQNQTLTRAVHVWMGERFPCP